MKNEMLANEVPLEKIFFDSDLILKNENENKGLKE